MKFHELTLSSKVDRKRVGRGISAGGGKTAGKGTKGQKARSGKTIKPGFEGGQTKLAMRLPKLRGFKHERFVTYQTVNIGDLKAVSGKTIDGATLNKAGLVKYADRPVKILGQGEVATAYNVSVQAVTKSAQAAIEKAEGKITINPLKKPAKKPEAATLKKRAEASK